MAIIINTKVNDCDCGCSESKKKEVLNVVERLKELTKGISQKKEYGCRGRWVERPNGSTYCDGMLVDL